MLVRQLHGATSINYAKTGCFTVGSSQNNQILICAHDALLIYRPDEDGDGLQQTHHVQLFDRLEAMLTIPGSACAGPWQFVLGFTTDLRAALLSIHPAGPHTVDDAPAQASVREHGCVQLPVPRSSTAARRIDGLVCSEALDARGAVHVAVSAHHDTVHLLRWASGVSSHSDPSNPAGQLQTTELQAAVVDLKGGALMDVRHGGAVHALLPSY